MLNFAYTQAWGPQRYQSEPPRLHYLGICLVWFNFEMAMDLLFEHAWTRMTFVFFLFFFTTQDLAALLQVCFCFIAMVTSDD